MKVPVFVIVQIFDAEGRGNHLVDLPAQPQVGGEVLADALVGVAVDVCVVQRAVLGAAVARAQRGRPLRGEAVARNGGGAPAWNIGLLPAEGVAGYDDKAGVFLDDRIGPTTPDRSC